MAPITNGESITTLPRQTENDVCTDSTPIAPTTPTLSILGYFCSLYQCDISEEDERENWNEGFYNKKEKEEASHGARRLSAIFHYKDCSIVSLESCQK